jgi:hypothetical protein
MVFILIIGKVFGLEFFEAFATLTVNLLNSTVDLQAADGQICIREIQEVHILARTEL